MNKVHKIVLVMLTFFSFKNHVLAMEVYNDPENPYFPLHGLDNWPFEDEISENEDEATNEKAWASEGELLLRDGFTWSFILEDNLVKYKEDLIRLHQDRKRYMPRQGPKAAFGIKLIDGEVIISGGVSLCLNDERQQSDAWKFYQEPIKNRQFLQDLRAYIKGVWSFVSEKYSDSNLKPVLLYVIHRQYDWRELNSDNFWTNEWEEVVVSSNLTEHIIHVSPQNQIWGYGAGQVFSNGWDVDKIPKGWNVVEVRDRPKNETVKKGKLGHDIPNFSTASIRNGNLLSGEENTLLGISVVFSSLE